MRSNGENSESRDISSEDQSTDLLSNLKDNLYSLISRKDTNKFKNGFNLPFIGQQNIGNEHFGTNYSEIRCQSLPDCAENFVATCKQKECDDLSDEILHNSPTSDDWFKTWPERCDKQRSTETSPINSPVSTKNQNTQTKFNCDNLDRNTKNKITLNEALKNISLAYSPVTKQLHLIEKSEVAGDNVQNVFSSELKNSVQENTGETVNENSKKKSGHKRTEAGSFSSTVSTLSDLSSNGSLLNTDDRSLCSLDSTNTKLRKRSLTHFFSKHVFPWKSSTPETNTSTSVWKLFTKQTPDRTCPSPIHVASSSALIQHERPSTLPAKTLEEEQRHRSEYKAILAAAKKKDAQTNAAKQKQQKQQLKLEEQQASSTKHFLQFVLPNWDVMRTNKKTLDLWWQGLPSSVRGKVWRLAIGNELNLTSQLYEICVCRAQSRLHSPEPPKCDIDNIDQESSMDVIQLDISRTFPHLCIFQEGGPYSETLHSLLAAYVCYRPDVGYVQGMSYIAAILILNMEQFDAFICFANLLNQPLHLSAFTLNQAQMQAYYSAYNQIFNYNLPKLYLHFEKSGLTPDLYLLDWIYTVFAKAMPLDIACRVWDVFLRDGYEFIFRTALGILHLNQDMLMDMDFIHGAQFLTRLPDDMSSDQLFKSIQLISTTIGKQSFSQIVEKCLFSQSETYRDLA